MSDTTRLPAFQFYPGDWLGNAKLKRCSHEQKGIWIDVMCLLHDEAEYGIARYDLREIANAVGTTVTKLRPLIARGVLKGADKGEIEAFIYTPRSGRKLGAPVTLIPAQSGPLWYSSRMVKDAYVRRTRGAGTRFGDAPNNSPKGSPKDPPDRTPDQSPSRAPTRRQSDGSSSSSSSSPYSPPRGTSAREAKPSEQASRFIAEIRQAMSSAGQQRTKPKPCEQLLPPMIARHGFDALMAAAKAFYATPEARKDEGQFQCGLQVALRDGRIEALVTAAAEKPKVDPAAQRERRIRDWRAGRLDWDEALFGPFPTDAEIEAATAPQKPKSDLFEAQGATQ